MTYKTAYIQGQQAKENGFERISPYTGNVSEIYWLAGFDGTPYELAR